MLRDTFVIGTANDCLSEQGLIEFYLLMLWLLRVTLLRGLGLKGALCLRLLLPLSSATPPASTALSHMTLPSAAPQQKLLPVSGVVLWITWPISVPAQLELLIPGLWEGKTLTCHGTLVHRDRQPEVHTINVEP